MLEVVNLSRTWRAGDRQVRPIHQLSFELEPGEWLAITAPSGCGKSTLFRLLAALVRPDSGEISLHNRHYSHTPDAALPGWRVRHLGLMVEHENLVSSMSALENVELPLWLGGVPRDERRTRALEMLEAVGALELHDRSARRLSRFAAATVALARALVPLPQLLVLDEPTGSLDSTDTEEFADLLLHMLSLTRTTTVLLTHDTRLAARFPDVRELRDGRLHDAGSDGAAETGAGDSPPAPQPQPTL